MYISHIIVTYILIIKSVIKNSTCAELKSNNRYSVCSCLSKLGNLGVKSSLPETKVVKTKEDWIKLNNCSISTVIRRRLKELGIDLELIKNLENENETREAVESIVNFINSIYKEYGYFNSCVDKWKYTYSKELNIECVEKSIPECNFRLFIKDEDSTKSINIRSEDVISSSSVSIPTGKYRQLQNDYLTRKIFRNKGIFSLDKSCFEAVASSGMYKNLSYVAHRDGKEVYLDFYFDDYGIIHSVRPTITIQQEAPLLNLTYTNKNLANTRSALCIISEINLFKLFNYNHRLTIDHYSDVLDHALWTSDSSDCTLLNVYARVTMNDMITLLKKANNSEWVSELKSGIKSKFKLKCKPKLSAERSKIKEGLYNLKEKASLKGLKDLKDSTLSNLKVGKVNTADNCSNNSTGTVIDSVTSIANNASKGTQQTDLRNSDLCVRLMKRLGNLRYVLEPSLGTSEVRLLNQVLYKLETTRLSDPILIDANLVNSYKYRDVIGANGSVAGGQNLRNGEAAYKYRAETSLMATLPSRCKLLCKYLYANRLNKEDYRGLVQNKLAKPFFLASHDVAVPITFKYKIVPYFGLFLDLLFPSRSLGELNLSLGVKFTVLRLNISIPLVNRVNSSYIFNKFSKDTQNFHFAL